MVITGGEGSEGLVTEYSGIAAGTEEEDGTPAKEVMHGQSTISGSMNCLESDSHLPTA